MNGWFILVSYLAAVNPARIRPYMSVGAERTQAFHLLTGAAVVVAAGLVLVLAGESILDWLDITDETWHLGAGVVCGFVGGRMLVAPQRGQMPLPGETPLVPVAFPLLFTPQLAVLAILFGATEPFGIAWGGLAVAVGIGAAVGLLRHRRPALWAGVARLAGAVLVVVAVALIVAGIRDV